MQPIKCPVFQSQQNNTFLVFVDALSAGFSTVSAGISLEAGNRQTHAATLHNGAGHYKKHSTYPEGSHQ